MCGFSKYVLSVFGWETRLGSDGLELINSESEVVGRLECFYGFRTDIGNRFPANQPYIQRWVVKKELFQNALDESKCPYQVKIAIGTLVTGAEE